MTHHPFRRVSLGEHNGWDDENERDHSCQADGAVVHRCGRMNWREKGSVRTRVDANCSRIVLQEEEQKPNVWISVRIRPDIYIYKKKHIDDDTLPDGYFYQHVYKNLTVKRTHEIITRPMTLFSLYQRLLVSTNLFLERRPSLGISV